MRRRALLRVLSGAAAGAVLGRPPAWAQAGRDLKIGMSAAFRGPSAGLGIELYRGAQAYYGVQPDLCALGKALRGGYPLGAVAGRADVLDLVREDRLGDERYVWFASSLGGNPVSAAAGLAALSELRKPGTYARLFALGERLRSGAAGQKLLQQRELKAPVACRFARHARPSGARDAQRPR